MFLTYKLLLKFRPTIFHDPDRVKLFLGEDRREPVCINRKLVNRLKKDPYQLVWLMTRNIGITRIFLKFGVDPNLETAGGETPLDAAACFGQVKVVAQLLAAGANARHATADRQWTALHSAVGLRDDGLNYVSGDHLFLCDVPGVIPPNQAVQVINLLVNAGADPNAHETLLGFSPLHLAANCAHAPECLALITAGAKVNDRDAEGYTPLHRAAEKGNLRVVTFLLGAGADPNVQDHQGRYPDQCCQPGDHVVAKLLRKERNKHVQERGA